MPFHAPFPIQFPRKLRPGSRVAVVAPSFIADEAVIDGAEAALRSLGLAPVLFPSCRAACGYLSGTDALRAADINRAFADPSIDGVFCLRGGYGAIRLLPLLDYALIRRNPKIFVGYSDATALLAVLQDRCSLAAFHGPMAAELPSADPFSVRSLTGYILEAPDSTAPAQAASSAAPLSGASEKNASPDTALRLFRNPEDLPLRPLFPLHADAFPAPGPTGSALPALPCSPVSAEGPLTGGNLTTLCSLLGTPYEPDLRGRILFLEDVGEQLYRIDRLLTSLTLSGRLSRCAGILLGSFAGCGPDPRHPERGPSLEELLLDRLRPAGIPVLTGLVCGHTDPQAALPFGRTARMTLQPPSLSFLPAGHCP